MKNFILKYKITIGVCVLTASLGIGWWVLGNPGTTTIGENITVGGSMTLGGVAKTSWPTGIPSGMIAMFDASCPSGWTRFTALDDKFPRGAATYGGTGGASSITLSVGQLPPHTHSASTDSTGSHTHGVLYTGGSGVAPHAGGGGAGQMSYETAAAGAHTHTISVDSVGSGASINILPPYLAVVWCKKD